MGNIFSLSIVVGGAVLAALAASVGLASAAHMTSRRGHGYMHMIFYAMLLMAAASTLLSGRDLSSMVEGMSIGDSTRHPLLALLQPLVSLFILTVTGERIITHWVKPQKGVRVPVVLLTAFVLFWVGTVAAPALFGAIPFMSHEFVYPVVIGTAMLMASTEERDMAFRAARNALLVYMFAGLVLIPLMPGLVLDTGYNQGLFPGVPRLAGLSPHPVTLGLLSQLGLLCLLAFPYERRWLNRLAWAVGLFVLFLAQSKTAWASFALCSACMLLAERGPAFMRRASDPVRKEFGVLAVLCVMLVVLLAMGVLILGDVGYKLNNFFNSAEGAQLSSLTGRDRIWAIAYDEWQRNPVFGYGPTLWSTEYRAAIGMPNATHAHNQFMDNLARSGTVGVIALMFFSIVLLVLSVRYTRASRGLTLALFVLILLRSISEVPLLLFGYGADVIAPMLLLMALASASSATRVPAKASYPANRSSPYTRSAPPGAPTPAGNGGNRGFGGLGTMAPQPVPSIFPGRLTGKPRLTTAKSSLATPAKAQP